MKFIRAASALFLGLGLVHGGIATCTVPTTSYTTLPKLFSINVLAGKDSFNVYLLPGHVDSNTYNKPLISSGTVSPVLNFNLTKGILYQSGFPANARYVPPPPHPTTEQEMLFGGNPTIPPNENFYAKYDCDANNNKILVLRTQQGFSVGSKDLGAELYITPNGYAGSTTVDFIVVKVKINGGV